MRIATWNVNSLRSRIDRVEAFVQLAAQGFGAGGAADFAVDAVLDGADDLFAGAGAAGGAGADWVLGDVAGEQDGAADGAGDALVGLGLGGGGGLFGDEVPDEPDAVAPSLSFFNLCAVDIPFSSPLGPRAGDIPFSLPPWFAFASGRF